MADRTARIRADDILLFAVLRNERVRLPYFLDYYRRLGVGHFLLVDNGSSDGSGDWLRGQEDVSLWHTDGSYRQSRYGMSWLNWLQLRHAHDHWAVTVDLDEFLVYPFCDSRPLRALTDWLDICGQTSFGALLLDMYPRGPIGQAIYHEGQNPFDVADWFDSGNYMIEPNPLYRNLWIQGGPRARYFFPDAPENAPSLNKIPLVRWRRDYAWVNSTHMMLPRSLNRVYETHGGERATGCLLHAKFLNTFPLRAAEEAERAEHFGEGIEYQAYRDKLSDQTQLWSRRSERFINWRQLEILGLMSKGNWA